MRFILEGIERPDTKGISRRKNNIEQIGQPPEQEEDDSGEDIAGDFGEDGRDAKRYENDEHPYWDGDDFWRYNINHGLRIELLYHARGAQAKYGNLKCAQ